jgi:endonuclease YncB( thermonuclease family)
VKSSGLDWRWYEKYTLGDPELDTLQHEAKQAKRGLWIDPDSMPPCDWGKDQNASRQVLAVAH